MVSRRATHAVAPARSAWWAVGSFAAGLALLSYVFGSIRGEETTRGLIVAPIILLLSAPLIDRIRRSETRFDLGGIVFAALGLKLLATYGRWWMVNTLYNGQGDSTSYHFYGSQFAESFRAFQFDVEVGKPIPGTGFLRVLTGIVYSVFGSDQFTGFLIFSMMSLIGCWFFYRAFTSAVPDGDHKRYAYLVLFWPSLVFWPAATGKEAWMILSLGLASWGAANVYRHLAHGFPLLALGIAGSAMPRPHIAIVVLAAVAVGLTAASLFGAGAGNKRGGAGLITKTLGVVFLLVAGSLLAPKLATFLNIDDVGGSGFSESLSDVEERTNEGGSTFGGANIGSPADYPWALITVLFRPFPYEVSSVATAISALEGLMLMGMVVLSVRMLIRIPAALVRNAYVAYSAAFTFMFVYVFAFIQNFGILARQRTQMLPFLFVLLALPLASKDEPKPTPRRPAASNRTAGPVHAARRTVAPPRAR